MNLANPPANKELLDYLAEGFVKSAYDMKWLHREITNSDTYQRSWRTTPSNKRDEKNFSHAVIRRLPAEVVFDSIAMAAAAAAEQEKLAGDLENRAIGPNATISGKVNGGDRYALTTFGKPSRNMNCDCERTSDPTLLQTIYTRNDPALIKLLDAKTGWIAELRQGGDTPSDLDARIEEVFLRTVSRPPAAAEFAQAKRDVAASARAVDGLRELLWTLLNTREFMVNH